MGKTGSKLINLPDTELANLADAELIARALEQNQAAYRELHKRYSAGVSAHIAQFVSLQEDIEDICIESFEKAFSHLVSYNKEYKFSTWLYRIAENTALDHISHKDREKNNIPTTSISEQNSELNEIPAETQNPEDEIIKQQEYEKLLANIDKLKKGYREIAKLCLIDNFGYKEIANELGLPINTVKTRIRRAKEQLLKMMDIPDEMS